MIGLSGLRGRSPISRRWRRSASPTSPRPSDTAPWTDAQFWAGAGWNERRVAGALAGPPRPPGLPALRSRLPDRSGLPRSKPGPDPGGRLPSLRAAPPQRSLREPRVPPRMVSHRHDPGGAWLQARRCPTPGARREGCRRAGGGYPPRPVAGRISAPSTARARIPSHPAGSVPPA